MVTSCPTSGEGNKTEGGREGGGYEGGLVLLQGVRAPVGSQSRTLEVRGQSNNHCVQNFCRRPVPPPSIITSSYWTNLRDGCNHSNCRKKDDVETKTSRINMWVTHNSSLDEALLKTSCPSSSCDMCCCLLFCCLTTALSLTGKIQEDQTSRCQSSKSFIISPRGNKVDLILDLFSAGDTSDTYY